jgi:hypothetical protein
MKSMKPRSVDCEQRARNFALQEAGTAKDQRDCGQTDGSFRMPLSEIPSRYRFFHPPRCPGAPPPVERGEGPNSGPDWRESVGWKILLPLPAFGLSRDGCAGWRGRGDRAAIPGPL